MGESEKGGKNKERIFKRATKKNETVKNGIWNKKAWFEKSQEDGL